MRLVVVALALLLPGIAARADEERAPSTAWSFGAGLAIAIVPLAVGGGLLATASTDGADPKKRAGIYVISCGLALAPIVSHLVAREYKRAAVFGAAPLVFPAVAIGVLEGTQSLLDDGTVPTRLTFGAALALELIASGIGLADSLMAGERYRARRLTLAPLFGRNQAGLSVGGSF